VTATVSVDEFNDIQAEMKYSLSERANVTVSIINSGGKTIMTRIIKPTSYVGEQSFIWDGKTSAGVPFPDDQYTFRVEAEDLQGWSAVRKSVKFTIARNPV